MTEYFINELKRRDTLENLLYLVASLKKIIPDFKMDLPKEIIDTMLQMALEIVPIIASVLSMPLN